MGDPSMRCSPSSSSAWHLVIVHPLSELVAFSTKNKSSPRQYNFIVALVCSVVDSPVIGLFSDAEYDQTVFRECLAQF